MAVLTRSRTRDVSAERPPMRALEFQAERWRRIRAHQEEDENLSEIKAFLNGEVDSFSLRRLRKIAKVADLFALDARGVLNRLVRSTRDRPRDAEAGLRPTVPRTLLEAMLHYAHEDSQGGHQGITGTHERLRSELYWPGMYADVERFVKECTDCASGEGRPPNPGPSTGIIESRRSFEVVWMDFVTHMPESARGNTFLVLFQDSFSGYVVCKPMSFTTAHDAAEAYEKQVFRRFGASVMIRNDLAPRFMSEVFTRYRELLGNKQRVTLAYRPQRNGQQERSVQTFIQSVKAYIAEADQSD
ncbi:unnamed protein product [Phytophthora fragariaefolia]|uniref:Unnamed protein product n=1 Tax=Phytophthora fragariaefolia TaxID=1490495 RepID=A0A9W6Y2X5_9STRA|nr:unnamed protein product [Phytophthora fragariaefolia]